MSMFFYLHGDAVGTALVLIGLAALLFVLQDRAHQRQRAGQRATFRAQLAAQRKELRAQYQPLIAALARRKPTFEEEVTQAVAHTRPPRIATPLSEAYVDPTIDTGCTPVFWDGRNR